MGDLANDDRGLARSRPGEHEGHVLVRSDGLGLFVRERVRQRREGGGLHSGDVIQYEKAVRLPSSRLESLEPFERLKPTERLPRFSFELLSDEPFALPQGRG